MNTKLLILTVLLAACGDESKTVDVCFGASTQCGDTCVNVASDQLNCGACGNACDANSICDNGTCTALAASCPMGQEMCGASCKDTQVDADNCGMCGNVCGTAAACEAGECVVSMWEGLASLPGGTTMFAPFVSSVSSFALGTNSGTLYMYLLPTSAVPLGSFDSNRNGPPVTFNDFTTTTWIGTTLYGLQGTSMYTYDIGDDSWATPINATLTHSVAEAECDRDDEGNVYVLASDQFLVSVKTSDSSVDYVQGPTDLPTIEPRAVWDTASKRLYLADYSDTTGTFYAYDPVTKQFTSLPHFPDLVNGIGDAFCSDRAGHIYADSSGNTDGTDMWMYTIATSKWSQLPNLPTTHGDSASCFVANGYLYVASNGAGGFARLKL